MIIKRKYKTDLTKSKILPTKNILSWKTESKDGYLEINELGWGFLWLLFKKKLKNKIYLLITPLKDENSHIEFFNMKK